MKTVPALLLVPACLACFPHPGQAQVSYRDDGRIVAAQRALPSTGPGSSWFNPAALSETRRVHAHAGVFLASAGKSWQDFGDISGTLPPHLAPWLPIGFSAGFSRFSNETRFDGSNAIFVEGLYRPALAVAYPPVAGGPLRLAAGLAFPIHAFDAFGAAPSSSTALDLGLLGIVEEKGTGRFRIGYAYNSLVNPAVELPDGRGRYKIPGWWVTSLGYVSPGEWVRVHWEYYVGEPPLATQGPNSGISSGMNTFEMEMKPIPWLGIKAEVTRVGRNSSLGAVCYPEYGVWPVRLHLEANVGHDRLDIPGLGWLSGPSRDEGRGYLFGISLGAGI